MPDKTILQMVPCVDAGDMPPEIDRYCTDELDISTHYASELHQIHDDGNPVAEWLKKQGFSFEGREWAWFGVWGT